MRRTDERRHLKGHVAHLSGLAAEDIVARLYDRAGKPVIARRWRGKAGEIDLVVQDDGELVFVEVKKARDISRAAHSLGETQIRRLLASAEEYVAGEPEGALTRMRFDVALVDENGGCEIIENALGAGW